MRVLINQLTALRHKAGIGHYIEQLAGGLRAFTELEIIAYPSGWTEHALKLWQKRSRRASPNAGSGGRFGWKQWASGLGRRVAEWNFRLSAAMSRFDIYHEPNLTPFPCDRRTIATIHDLSLLLHPQWHPAERVRHFEAQVSRALGQCQHFIAISEFSRRQAIEQLGVAEDRVTCVLNGYRTHLLTRSVEGETSFRGLGLPSSYLLYVGTLEPRKNLLMLTKAYCALPAALREKCPLVLAGGWGWNVQDLACYYQEEARHKNVMHLGYVSEEVLGALYRNARALVYPSHYEGFGLPVLEMLALGGSVLCSSAGALREVVGEHGFFLDPNDGDGWHAALRRLIVEDEWVDRLRATSVAHHHGMTWQRCARGTYAVYQQVMGEKAGVSPLNAA